jgi:molecular chaperone GrpE (heat shock protein)
VSETDGEQVRPIDEPVPEEAAASPSEKITGQGESGAGAALAGLASRLAKVEEQLAEFHRRAAHRELVIDRLHEENTELRSGLSRIILEPVVADLIRLYDQLDRESRRLESNAENWQLMRSFADDVALILDRCGIEVFSAEPGEPFQADRHRPLAVVPCDDQARHNTVAEVLAAGFAERESGRVRRPVQARFHRYIPTAGAAGHDDDASQSQ